jgi:methionine-rich copper-binding protein CopC
MGFFRRIISAVAFAVLLACHATPGAAHAVLVESSPQPGSVVTAPELDVRLRFNARIDHERSSLTLIGPKGESRIDTKAATASPDMMTGKLHALTPGKYRLHWQVLAVDGHITRGNVEFEVRAP